MTATFAELPRDVREAAHSLQRGTTMLAPQYDVAIEKTASGVLLVSCIKCWGHSVEAELQPDEDFLPKYNHQFTRPTRIVKWHVAKAWRLVRASGRAPQPINRDWLDMWIRERSQLIRDHMHHIPPEHLRKPLLLDSVWQECQYEASGAWMSTPFPLLLDGHHRAARSLREGWLAEGFVLTKAEQAQVVTVEMDAFDPELVGWRSRQAFENGPGTRWDPRLLP